jgi:enoyl-CoA hydratase/carnithine racemase
MNFETLGLREENNVLYVTIQNPPINLFSGQMVKELFMLSGSLMQRKDIGVVVFDSADPDFFIAHFDLEELEKAGDDPASQSKYPDINIMQSVALNWQAIPQVTIAKVNGRVRGAGLEFIQALDMRFASEDSLLGFPEAGGGFLACGGGATRTFISAGPARALEILLSGRDFTGTEAERYNLINRALPADQLDAYVDDLVARVSKVLPEVVATHREVFKNFTDPQANNFFAALNSENVGFAAAIEAGRVQAAAAEQLKVGQTREVELDLPASLQKLNN